jgi:hypothetical protein
MVISARWLTVELAPKTSPFIRLVIAFVKQADINLLLLRGQF